MPLEFDHDAPPTHLAGRFTNLKRLAATGFVYRFQNHPADGGLRVVKILLGSYPTTLHRELAAKGFMPELLAEPIAYPGGYMMVEMEYLDPADGWASLYNFNDSSADPLNVEIACKNALLGLQDCLGGTAVHGDLRAPNIFIRWGLSLLLELQCVKMFIMRGIKLLFILICMSSLGRVVPQKGAPVAVPLCSGLRASEGEEHGLQHR